MGKDVGLVHVAGFDGQVFRDKQEMELAVQNYVSDSDEEKRLVRKIDLSLMPILWLMYIFNYVDRTNIGNAKISGMGKDLNLDDNRYAWVLSIFFFGYLIMEVPSNMILSRSRPKFFLPGIMLLWGILSALMSVCKSYSALLAFRVVLGCIESGFFAGALFLMSCWYKTHEIGKRIAAFYTAAVLSGAFGGIVAGAISSSLHNAHGISGWRWLFIIEGSCTVGVSIIAFFVLLDFPATSGRLSLREKQLATIRLRIDSGDVDQKDRLSHWAAFKSAICDARTYTFMLLFVLDVGAGTISYFIPTITKTLGYTASKAQYMTVPIYVVAAIVLVFTAWSSDRNKERRWHVTAALALGFIASVVCTVATSGIVRYVMLCFVASGIWAALPLILSWVSNTITLPAEKRAIVLALVNAFGNLSSVWGSRIWLQTDAPLYRIGWGVTAGFLGGGMVLAAIIPALFRFIPNKTIEPKERSQAGNAADSPDVSAKALG